MQHLVILIKKTSKFYWELHKTEAIGYQNPLEIKSIFEKIKDELYQLEVILNKILS